MKAEEIRITAEARKLLAELVDLHDKYMDQTAELSSLTLPGNLAVQIGADRELTRRQINGCAYRLTNEVRTPRTHATRRTEGKVHA